MSASVLVVACGAIARELVAVLRGPGWEHIDITCLPPELHNRPAAIPGAVRARLESARDRYASVFVAYADCGTGGALDRVLDAYGVERLPGAHCYEFLAGGRSFEALCNAEPGTFFLTDFLAKHFERLVVRGLGIDRHPELRDVYFANYRKLVYLQQQPDEAIEAAAEQAAVQLGLSYQKHLTRLAPLEVALAPLRHQSAA